MTAAAGLLLLTGGRGLRLGGPKHLRPHPGGGTWGGHLVSVFAAVFPGGPIQLLGEALPDHPELKPLPDPLQGPAVALRHWAGQVQLQPLRWWIVACDQVRWTTEALAGWHAAAAAADPRAEHWVLARVGGRIQPLGGFLPGALAPRLAAIQATSLMTMAAAMPSLILPTEGDPWLDVDTQSDLDAYLGKPGQPKTR